MSEQPTDLSHASDETPETDSRNPFWKAVVFTSFLFVGTACAIAISPIADQRAPVNQFIQKHGNLLAAIEVGVILTCGVLAMSTDRKLTLEAKNSQVSRNSPPAGDSADVG